jgi:hypothetical protein
MRSSRSAVVVVLAIVLAMSCSPEEPVYADRPFCSGDRGLTVTAGTTPTIDWTGGCRVWALVIERMAPSEVMWHTGEDDESFDGPVVYGQLLPGAGQMAPARPLQSGVEYRAVLVQRSDGGRVIEETRFTP